jgi:hypothetical protein
VKSKILELISLSGEASVIVSDYLSDYLTENGLVGKVVLLCADNTSSSFSGAQSKSENNVFTRLQKNFGHGLLRVWCACHIPTKLYESLLR